MNLETLSQNYVVLTIGSVCLILILNSWTLPIIVISAVLGYYSFDRFQLHMTRFLNCYLDDGTNATTALQFLRHLVSSYFRSRNSIVPATTTGNYAFSYANSNHGATGHETKIPTETIFDPLLHNNLSSASPQGVPQTTIRRQSSSPLLKLYTETDHLSSKTSTSPAPLILVNSSTYTEDQRPVPQVLSPAVEIPKVQLVNRTKVDLKIDEVLDKHIAKLFKAIFSIYISPEWAPYETRQLLRRTLRKLLVTFAERVKQTFFEFDPNQPEIIMSNEKLVKFFREKVIPIAINHLNRSSFPNSEKSQEQGVEVNGSNSGSHSLSSIQLKRLNWKVRRLSKQLLVEFMPKEDRDCKLWVELGVSILGDGVLWNCILLGKDELPKIIEEALEHLLLNISSSNYTCDGSGSSTDTNVCKCSDYANSSQLEFNVSECHCDHLNKGGVSSTVTSKHVPDQHINTEYIPSLSAALTKPYPPRDINRKYVHMLLDSFLDPNLDVEEPPQIVSRWRPTLNEILIERDLLYCLIQYLRMERALEYLQAVLDDSPDGSAYCRRILELEYLPQFFRSKLYMECLGLKLEELGVEAGTSESLLKPNGSTKFKKSGAKHSRTGSSGSGISSSIFKSTGIVDGLAIPPSAMPADGTGYASASTLLEAEQPKKRRQHILQPFIKKFFESASSFSKPLDTSLPKKRASRIGVDAKSYQEMNHSDVLSCVSIEPCDIYTCFLEIGASWVNRASWLESVIIGWGQLLRPLLKPKFDKFLDEKLEELLTLDNFAELIDLITTTFIASQSVPSDSNDDSLPIQNSEKLEPPKPNIDIKFTNDQNSTVWSKFVHLLSKWAILNAFDYPQIVTSVHMNKDEFILFFVDILDLLVQELTKKAQ